MLNTSLFKPANVIVIGIIAIATHVFLKPLYAKIGTN